MLLVALLLISAPPPAPGAQDAQGPIDFRCDGMQVFSKPNRVHCTGNVVVRRRDVLLCCEIFDGVADESWQWQKFTCTNDVRAQRPDELMESDEAVFVLGTSDLVLTGRPRLQRAQSLLAGERIVVDVKTNEAQIEKPRGRIEQADSSIDKKPLAAQVDEKQLPAVCPVPRIMPPREPLPTKATKPAADHVTPAGKQKAPEQR
jgi:lipopolysaccharide export system protein LptA